MIKNSKRPPNLAPKPPFPYEKFQSWLRENTNSDLQIEIGCGVGLHPILWAKENPQSRLLAIERTVEKFNKFRRRLDNHPEITNVWPAHADATHLLPHLDLPSQTVSCIFILYPNPDPKPQHRLRRWAHNPLMDYLVTLLKPSGTIHFATNLQDYAQELRTTLPQRLPLKLTVDDLVPKENKARTHFEKKYLARGDTCQSLVFTKI
jgi:tRNA G46 methylase TrmB